MFEFNTQELHFNVKGVHLTGAGLWSIPGGIGMSLTEALYETSRSSQRDRGLTEGFINGRCLENLRDAVIANSRGRETGYLGFSSADSLVIIHATGKDKLLVYILRPTLGCDEWFVSGHSNEEVFMKLIDELRDWPAPNPPIGRALRVAVQEAAKTIPSGTLQNLLEYARAAFG